MAGRQTEADSEPQGQEGEKQLRPSQGPHADSLWVQEPPGV